MWSKLSTLPTPLGEKVVYRGTPSILFGFPHGSPLPIYTPGWRETMWNEVIWSRKTRQHDTETKH